MSHYQSPPGAPGFPPPGQPAPYPQPQQTPYAQPQQAYGAPPPPYGAPQQPPPPYGAPVPVPAAPPAYGAPAPYAQPQQAYGAMPPPQRGGGRPPADPLAGFDEADPTGSRLPHFNADRRYFLENTKVEFFQGRNDDFINLEFNVLESDDPMLPPGRSAKYMIKMGQDMSMPNFKSVLGALLGYSTKEEIVANVTESVGRSALSDQQPMKGRRTYLNTTGTTTRQNKPFTVHNWTPASPATSAAPPQPQPQPATQPSPQLPYHPQAAMMGQGYQPNMAPPAAAPAAAPPPPAWAAQPAAWPAPGQPFPAPAAPPPAPFPPAGWYAHPGQPGAFHNTKETISEADLRARMAQGRA